MNVRQIPLNERAFLALDKAAQRDGHDWLEACKWLDAGEAAVWQIGETGYVLTLANGDNEIEVLMAGGSDARACVEPWEAAMLAHPAHKGMTLRVEGRKGWRRLLPHWKERDGVLTMKVPG